MGHNDSHRPEVGLILAWAFVLVLVVFASVAVAHPNAGSPAAVSVSAPDR